MIKISSSIDSQLVQPLEDFFCEDISHWTIIHPRPEDEITLTGYFDNEKEGLAAWEELRESFRGLPEIASVETVRDEDWMESYKHHLKPWSCGRLQWVPEWERDTFPVPEGSAVAYLDSGLAFGTGSHETTRLCARALVRYVDKFDTAKAVIDAGCGSGILALSAVKLGFTKVYAFDNDPEAIRVTLENAAANGVKGILETKEAGIEEGLAGRQADLLLANIQANILNIYSKELLSAVAPGGWLALSGILAHEAENVAQKFGETAADEWGSVENPTVETDGEWSLVLFLRN